MIAKVMKIEAGPDADLETLRRHASDDLLALVAARPGTMQEPSFRDLLARARRLAPRGETNTARSALSMFKFDWLRA